MMAMIGLTLFAGVLVLCGLVLAETLLPAWPRIAALLSGEATPRSASFVLAPLPPRRRAMA